MQNPMDVGATVIANKHAALEFWTAAFPTDPHISEWLMARQQWVQPSQLVAQPHRPWLSPSGIK